MTGPEVREARSELPVLLPLGAIEQHGPHLPLDSDVVVARGFAAAVAERLPLVLAPSPCYGAVSHPSSGGGELFPGTVSLSGQTLIALVRDLVLALARHGRPDVVIINGHWENTSFAIEGARLASAMMPELNVLMINWWELVGDEELDRIFDGGFPGWEAEHAGILETSLVMHFDPERVHVDRIEDRIATVTPPAFTRFPEPEGQVDASGVLRTASGASARIGEEIVGVVAPQIAQIVRRELSTPSSRAG